MYCLCLGTYLHDRKFHLNWRLQVDYFNYKHALCNIVNIMRKTLVGPQLRQLRREHNHTQAEMAARLKISPAYVNLLENNQRSLSVQVLLSLTEAYGVDLRELVNDKEVSQLADLRAVLTDPAFHRDKPDLQELRAAIDHAPKLVDLFLQIYRSHRDTVEHIVRTGGDGTLEDLLPSSPETLIHDYFRDNRNYFDPLEKSADRIRQRIGGPTDDLYAGLKTHLAKEHNLTVSLARITDMPDTLRLFDRSRNTVLLSEALDHPNRVFQLAHVLALVEAPDLLESLMRSSRITSDAGLARCQVELANYFAAAFLMPYDKVLQLAEVTAYDVDLIAAALGVSFEQVCHRLTTLQRDGARGVPFFFLRIDKAGNVTKRFNSTSFALAEKGGSCPVWNIHDAFRQPGVILPQVVEMPDGGQFFTISRTLERPVFNRRTQDRRLVLALGCERSYAHKIGYAAQLNLEREEHIGKIGINCHLCPRQACSQRAHQPVHVDLPINTNRRGNTRYES